MKLSCLIPNYNDCKILPKSLANMLLSPVDDMEVIIIDDGSTDNSWEVISELAKKDSRIKIVRASQNQGVVKTLMLGFELAKGEFLYMGSANDWVLPGFFEKALSVLEQFPDLGFFCGNAILDYGSIQTPSDIGWGGKERYFSPRDLAEHRRSKISSFHGQSVVMRRSYIPPNEELSEALKGNFDLFIFFAIAFRHGFYFSPEKYAWVNMSDSTFSAREKTVFQKIPKVQAYLETLDRAYYIEIKKGMVLSGLLSFLGVPLLLIILSKFRQDYLSWKLLKNLSYQNWCKIVRKTRA